MYLSVKVTKTLYVTTRKAWRAWLSKHHRSAKEIWLIFYRKESGKPRIEYNDAVEEALCFGWIDSIVKRLDNHRFAQRFSPRNPTTPYSQSNRERLQRLLRQRKVSKEVRATLRGLGSRRKFKTPEDILAALRANRDAWRHFQKFSDRYRRIRVAFIDGARTRPHEFRKRLAYFVKMSAENRQFGFGGIEKYF